MSLLSPSAREREATLPGWAMTLLRCPHCMSALDQGTTRGAAAEQGMSALDRGTTRDTAASQGRPSPEHNQAATCDAHGFVPDRGRRSGDHQANPSETAPDPGPPGSAAALKCSICERTYPWAGAGPRLRREDDLAVLAQDVVTFRVDPDASLLSHRVRVSLYERRNRFLARMMARDEPGDASESAADAIVSKCFERFTAMLPPAGAVLDLGYGPTVWTLRLVERGLHVLHFDHGSQDAATPFADTTGATLARVEATALEMPCATATLDGVWCQGLFSRIRADRRTVFFRQIHRALRPGGLLFLSASTAGLQGMLGDYLLWRLMREQPVLFGEQVARTADGWSFQAQMPARALHDLVRRHGLRTLWLHAGEHDILLLARKV
jgi:SAM-dependent methyltransferase